MFQIFPIFFLPDLQEHTEQTDPVDLLPETIHQSTESPTLPPTLSMVELFNKRRQKLMQRKLRIAELSNSILENPQESVSREPKCHSHYARCCLMNIEKFPRGYNYNLAVASSVYLSPGYNKLSTFFLCWGFFE